ncbi:5'-methylthioadenosine/S-adenosylhomocysteine nucleosidase [Paludibaculum fermentans]|uniref:5'-methylthioadenosine/S-adenosylhomocysteine nucleosidase n=1 Tax=Paludibaculum fermentans TaxID=1473598 RepID=UPI003EBB0CA0
MTVTRRTMLAALAGGAAASAKAAPDLLIQGALDSELGPLLEALSGRKEVRLHAWTFWTGRIGRQNIVISRTDMGPINAAAVTSLGIREFQPRAIINQGTAGGHNRSLKLWDIVLGEKTTDYAAFSALHGDPGQGQSPANWKPVPHRIRANGRDPVAFPSFTGDPRLLSVAEKVQNPRGRVVRGNIGSAYQFNRQIDHIDWLHRTYGTDSEDMESAYSAGAALAMGVPLLAIRIISDTEWEHPAFEKIAGHYCAEFVVNVVKAL